MTQAAWWYRHQTARCLRKLRDPRWQLVLAVTPDHGAHHDRLWPRDLARLPQGRGDLGRRMASALASVSQAPVVLIGSDVPDITPTHIAGAFAALGARRAVFGPATDGGFWLIGLQRGALAYPRMFEGVRWSRADTLEQSLAALAALNPARVTEMRDVDTVNDLMGKPARLGAARAHLPSA